MTTHIVLCVHIRAHLHGFPEVLDVPVLAGNMQLRHATLRTNSVRNANAN
jgi:hypothetical protein